ncbi:MAG TPA: glycoside hydrolase family 73 protein [Chloroflexota bacterium]|nr:glycoside hydrolase family 73 protein [Chloroflexota bacterium]
MLRLAVAFVLALTVGGVVTGVSLVRFFPAVGLGSGGSQAGAAAPAAAAVPMRHLPAWVQTREEAVLWSGPDRQAVGFTRLAPWTFLKVSGVEADRLRVEYAGDGATRQAGPGWISLSEVQPSDRSGTWLRSARRTTLVASGASGGNANNSAPNASSTFGGNANTGGPNASGTSRGNANTVVPQAAWLVRLDDNIPAAADRLHVRVYAPTLDTVLGEGWLPTADLIPSEPPAQSVSTTADATTPVADAAPPLPSHDSFILSVGAAAREALQTVDGVPASVTVAQAILESNWGQSQLTREANNYFGIKAQGQVGNDGAVWLPTLEYANGGSYTIAAPFRAYKSLADSVVDHARLFQQVSLYSFALQASSDPDEFARRIARAGYATDPQYAEKVIDLMKRYDLYRFDTPVTPGAARTA